MRLIVVQWPCDMALTKQNPIFPAMSQALAGTPGAGVGFSQPLEPSAIGAGGPLGQPSVRDNTGALGQHQHPRMSTQQSYNPMMSNQGVLPAGGFGVPVPMPGDGLPMQDPMMQQTMFQQDQMQMAGMLQQGMQQQPMQLNQQPGGAMVQQMDQFGNSVPNQQFGNPNHAQVNQFGMQQNQFVPGDQFGGFQDQFGGFQAVPMDGGQGPGPLLPGSATLSQPLMQQNHDPDQFLLGGAAAQVARMDGMVDSTQQPQQNNPQVVQDHGGPAQQQAQQQQSISISLPATPSQTVLTSPESMLASPASAPSLSVVNPSPSTSATGAEEPALNRETTAGFNVNAPMFTPGRGSVAAEPEVPAAGGGFVREIGGGARGPSDLSDEAALRQQQILHQQQQAQLHLQQLQLQQQQQQEMARQQLAQQQLNQQQLLQQQQQMLVPGQQLQQQLPGQQQQIATGADNNILGQDGIYYSGNNPYAAAQQAQQQAFLAAQAAQQQAVQNQLAAVQNQAVQQTGQEPV